jgi:hypothetical protein
MPNHSPPVPTMAPPALPSQPPPSTSLSRNTFTNRTNSSPGTTSAFISINQSVPPPPPPLPTLPTLSHSSLMPFSNSNLLQPVNNSNNFNTNQVLISSTWGSNNISNTNTGYDNTNFAQQQQHHFQTIPSHTFGNVLNGNDIQVAVPLTALIFAHQNSGSNLNNATLASSQHLLPINIQHSSNSTTTTMTSAMLSPSHYIHTLKKQM